MSHPDLAESNSLFCVLTPHPPSPRPPKIDCSPVGLNSFPKIIINEPGLFPIVVFADDDVSDIVPLLVHILEAPGLMMMNKRGLVSPEGEKKVEK